MARELDGPRDGDGRERRDCPTDAPAQELPGGLRVAFASGTGRDDASVVVRVEAGRSIAVDPTGRRVSLAIRGAPRPRLSAAGGRPSPPPTAPPRAPRTAAGGPPRGG